MSNDARDSDAVPPSKRSARRSTRIGEMLNTHGPRKTPMGVDTAWALKLKETINAAVRELHVEVLSAKPIYTDTASDSGIMRFELETDRGLLEAVRSRNGIHSFEWK